MTNRVIRSARLTTLSDSEDEASNQDEGPAKTSKPPQKRRTNVAHQESHTETPFLHIHKLETSSMQALITEFQQQCPGSSRASVLNLPEKIVIKDRFFTGYITTSQGRQSIMGVNKWRFVVQEVGEEGLLGELYFLSIAEFLPDLEQLLPEPLQSHTIYPNFSKAPVVLISGFFKQRNELGLQKIQIVCLKENSPRILIGMPKEDVQTFFQSDFTPPQKRPFSAFLSTSGHQIQPAVCTASAKIPLGFTLLSSLGCGPVFNVIGAVSYFFNTPKTVRNGFMIMCGIVDQSVNLLDNGKVDVCLYTDQPQALPVIRSRGDVILFRGLRYGVYGAQKQLKGDTKKTSFTVIPKDTDFSASTNRLRPSEKDYVRHLMDWFATHGEPQIVQWEIQLELNRVAMRNPASNISPSDPKVNFLRLRTPSGTKTVPNTETSEEPVKQMRKAVELLSVSSHLQPVNSTETVDLLVKNDGFSSVLPVVQIVNGETAKPTETKNNLEFCRLA